MNNLRKLKIVVDYSIMDPELKKYIKHTDKYLMMLDSSNDDNDQINSIENFENCEETNRVCISNGRIP